MVTGIKSQLDLQSISKCKSDFGKLLQDLQSMSNAKPIDIKINNGSSVNQQINLINNNIQNLNNTVNNTNSSFGNFGSSTGSLIGFFTRWLTVSTLVMGSLRELKSGLNEIMDINKSDVNIAMITNQSVENVEKMNVGLLETAKNLGVLNKEVMSGFESWERSGVSIAEANENLVTSTKLAKIAGEENKVISDELITIKNAWDLNAKGVKDYASAVVVADNNSATSAIKVNKAMTYASQSFKENGIDMLNGMAMITNFSEKSSKSGESIGRSFVSMTANFHKMQDSVKDGDKNETDAVNKLEMLLSKKGVALRKSKNEWNDLSSVIKNIQLNIGKFTEVEKSDLAFKIGGKENMELTLSTLNNMKRIDELNTKLKEDSGAKAITSAYEKYMDSIEYKTNNLKNQVTELWTHLINSKQIKSGVEDLTTLVKIIEQLGTEDKKLLGLGASFVVLVKVIRDLKLALAELGTMEAVFGGLVSAINPVTLALVAVGATLGALAYHHEKHKEVVKNLSEAYKELNEVTNGKIGDKSKESIEYLKKEQTELKRLIELKNKSKTPDGVGVRAVGSVAISNTDKAERDLKNFTNTLKEAGIVYNATTGDIEKLVQAEKNVANDELLKRLEDTKNKLNETYTNTTSVINFYKTIQDEINTTGKISDSSYSEIAKNHKDLVPYLDNEKEMYKHVSTEIEKEKSVAKDTYNKMMGYSVDYYNSILKNSTILVDAKNAGYKTDLSNFKSLEQAKIAIAQESLKQIAGGYASFFNMLDGSLDTNKADKMIDAKNTILKAGNPYQTDRHVEKVKGINPLTGKVEIKDKVTFVGRPSTDSDFKTGNEEYTKLRELENKTKADAKKRADLFSKYDPKFDSSKLDKIGGSGSVGYTPSSDGASNKADKANKAKAEKQDVANLELKIERYYRLEEVLQRVESELSKVGRLEQNATELEKMKLKEKEIALLNEKKVALQNIYKEQGKEAQQIADLLKKQGIKFDNNGSIVNRNELLTSKTNSANKLTGDSKKTAIDNVKKFEEEINKYQEVRFSKITDSANKIFEIEVDRINKLEELEKLKISNVSNENDKTIANNEVLLANLEASSKYNFAEDNNIAQMDILHQKQNTYNDDIVRTTENLAKWNAMKPETKAEQDYLNETIAKGTDDFKKYTISLLDAKQAEKDLTLKTKFESDDKLLEKSDDKVKNLQNKLGTLNLKDTDGNLNILKQISDELEVDNGNYEQKINDTLGLRLQAIKDGDSTKVFDDRIKTLQEKQFDILNQQKENFVKKQEVLQKQYEKTLDLDKMETRLDKFNKLIDAQNQRKLTLSEKDYDSNANITATNLTTNQSKATDIVTELQRLNVVTPKNKEEAILLRDAISKLKTELNSTNASTIEYVKTLEKLKLDKITSQSDKLTQSLDNQMNKLQHNIELLDGGLVNQDDLNLEFVIPDGNVKNLNDYIKTTNTNIVDIEVDNYKTREEQANAYFKDIYVGYENHNNTVINIIKAQDANIDNIRSDEFKKEVEDLKTHGANMEEAMGTVFANYATTYETKWNGILSILESKLSTAKQMAQQLLNLSGASMVTENSMDNGAIDDVQHKANGGMAGGKAVVGEKGRELAILPNGKIVMLGTEGYTLANLPKDTQVINNDETEKIMSQGGYKDVPHYANGTGGMRETDLGFKNSKGEDMKSHTNYEISDKMKSQIEKSYRDNEKKVAERDYDKTHSGDNGGKKDRTSIINNNVINNNNNSSTTVTTPPTSNINTPAYKTNPIIDVKSENEIVTQYYDNMIGKTKDKLQLIKDTILKLQTDLKTENLSQDTINSYQDSLNAQIALFYSAQNSEKTLIKAKYDYIQKLREKDLKSFIDSEDDIQERQKLNELNQDNKDYGKNKLKITEELLANAKKNDELIKKQALDVKNSMENLTVGSFEWNTINDQLKLYNEQLEDSNYKVEELNNNIKEQLKSSILANLEAEKKNAELNLEIEKAKKIKQYDDEIEALQKVDAIEAEKEERLKRQNDLIEIQTQLKETQNERNVKQLKKNEDGSFAFYFIADQKKIDDLTKQNQEKLKDNSKWEADLVKNKRIKELNDLKAETEKYYSNESFKLSQHYSDMDLLVKESMANLTATYGTQWDKILEVLTGKIDTAKIKYNELLQIQNDATNGLSSNPKTSNDSTLNKDSGKYSITATDKDGKITTETLSAKEYESGEYDMILDYMKNTQGKKVDVKKLDTGGMLKNWNNGNANDNGKLAYLHPNEVVNNPIDTTKLLKASEFLANVNLNEINSKLLDMKTQNNMMNIPKFSIPSINNNSNKSETMNQYTFTGDLSFPNMDNNSGIKDFLSELNANKNFKSRGQF